MRVVLASAPHADTFGYSMPPPGLLRLGGALRAAGCAVELDDLAHRLAAGELPAGEELFAAAAERLCAGGAPALVGLSTMGATLPAALLIAQELRRRAPEAAIIFGGPGCHGVDEALLERFPEVDAVARGEGEELVIELWHAVRRGGRGGLAGIAGLTWRAEKGEAVREPERAPMQALDELPPYAWELLPPIARYKEVTGELEGLVPIDSGRGCVHDCSFCTIGRYWGRRSRPLPVARLVEEIVELRQIAGARRAYLCHDLFGADRAHALELCAALEQRAPDLPWEVRARVDHLDQELVTAMGAAGCYRVLLGIESADARVLEACDKHLSAGCDTLGRVRALIEAGVTPILSCVLGLPGEDEAALAATLDFALAASLAGGVNVSLHLPNPQPGCGLGEELGADARPVAEIAPDMALGAGETRAERALIEAAPALFSTFALLTEGPGGVEHLRDLFRIASELPRLLEELPRAFALQAQAEGLGALELWRRIAAHGAGFEAYLEQHGSPLAREALAWEELRREVGRAPEPGPPSEHARSRARLLECSHDLGAIARRLAAGEEPGEPRSRPGWLAVVRTERGVKSLSVSNDVARLLQALDGHAPVEALGLDDEALERLIALELLDPAASERAPS